MCVKGNASFEQLNHIARWIRNIQSQENQSLYLVSSSKAKVDNSDTLLYTVSITMKNKTEIAYFHQAKN